MIFEQGDIIYIDLDPQTGHEQKGRRPAIVISNNVYNAFTRAAMVCPISNTDKNIPTQIKLNGRTQISGIIMCEQVKALDISKRSASFFEKAPQDVIDEVVDMVYSFIEIL
jgi:mRNA interferase MazF